LLLRPSWVAVLSTRFEMGGVSRRRRRNPDVVDEARRSEMRGGGDDDSIVEAHDAVRERLEVARAQDLRVLDAKAWLARDRLAKRTLELRDAQFSSEDLLSSARERLIEDGRDGALLGRQTRVSRARREP